MKYQSAYNSIESEPNPLAAILFIFGALNIYSSLKKQKGNDLKLMRLGLKFFTPLLWQIFIVVCIGNSLIEVWEIFKSS